MTMDFEKISLILRGAKERGDQALLEPEGLDVLKALGIATRGYLFVRNSSKARVADTGALAGKRVVVKVVSPRILHKTDVGGVCVVANDREAIVSAIQTMERNLCEQDVAGFTISEFIDYNPALGNELLLGLRWTDDFGPVVTLGPGGIYTEFLSENFKAGREVAILSPESSSADVIERAIQECAVTRLITTEMRGCPPRIGIEQIRHAAEKFLALARELTPRWISECEINPLVVAEGRLVALDVLIKLGGATNPTRAARPISKLKNLLEPKSIAIIGVSEKLNPGHIIVNNLIREGFDHRRIYLVKPGTDEIEGCRCYPNISSLPERVDLFILAISASQTPEAIAEIIDAQKAESLIVIPGGLGEKHGSNALVSRIDSALVKARATRWGGPVINGGNCLGIRSQPGHYDTMFIPEYKLPVSKGEASPVAIISQSGAFAISRASKLTGVNPKYSISVGNQMDLTVGDFLMSLKDDPDIAIFAVYVEGFAPLDGMTFLKAAKEITASGRTVILYRAGRTPAGAKASSSHTASIAGDYTVTRQLCKAAGVIVADTLAGFEELARLSTLLRRKRVSGLRLGAISNAGFECVAVADNLGRFTLPGFQERTTDRLRSILKRCRIDSVVDAHNPLDVTPMMDDEAFEEAVRAVMEDDGIDIAVVGCVPLTAALNTLAPGQEHLEDIYKEDSIAMRLAKLNKETLKPLVAIVDAGRLYDPMANLLEEKGVPTFRTADDALRAFNVFCTETMKTRERSELPIALEPRVVSLASEVGAADRLPVSEYARR
ncbi:MAG TPA: acetate--CoA ligase family protein [Blastocatellia bacterium]|nr:acetate--CoA ligase family protein [Blastocatellia bacterium]